MRKIFYYLLCFTVLMGCNLEKLENDLTEENLNGKVKSIKGISYNVSEKFGKIEKTEIAYSYDVSFTKQGFTEEMIEYKPNGNITERYIIKYDDDNNIVDEIEYDSQGNIEYKEVCKYNEQGQLLEKIHYNSEGSVERRKINKYDENGFLVEEIEYKRHEIEERTIFKYDARGNKIESNEYDSQGKLSYKHTYEYDNNSNEISVRFYDKDNRLFFSSDKKFDYRNNEIEKKWYREIIYSKFDEHDRIIKSSAFRLDSSFISEKTYKYDNNGNEIERCYFISKEELAEKSIYEFDKYNNRIKYEKHKYGSLEFSYRYDYTYDKKNNWIKRITFKNNIPEDLTERVIHYY